VKRGSDFLCARLAVGPFSQNGDEKGAPLTITHTMARGGGDGEQWRYEFEQTNW
jgi:hypothetical protein